MLVANTAPERSRRPGSALGTACCAAPKAALTAPRLPRQLSAGCPPSPREGSPAQSLRTRERDCAFVPRTAQPFGASDRGMEIASPSSVDHRRPPPEQHDHRSQTPLLRHGPGLLGRADRRPRRRLAPRRARDGRSDLRSALGTSAATAATGCAVQTDGAPQSLRKAGLLSSRPGDSGAWSKYLHGRFDALASPDRPPTQTSRPWHP